MESERSPSVVQSCLGVCLFLSDIGLFLRFLLLPQMELVSIRIHASFFASAGKEIRWRVRKH